MAAQPANVTLKHDDGGARAHGGVACLADGEFSLQNADEGLLQLPNARPLPTNSNLISFSLRKQFIAAATCIALRILGTRNPA
jgi:hypothetical protein